MKGGNWRSNDLFQIRYSQKQALIRKMFARLKLYTKSWDVAFISLQQKPVISHNSHNKIFSNFDASKIFVSKVDKWDANHLNL